MIRRKNFGNHLSRGVVLLILFQMAISFGSVYLSDFTLSKLDATHVTTYSTLPPHALVFTAVIILSLFAIGLYRNQLRGTMDQIILQILVGMGLASIVLSVLYYFFPPLDITRGVMALADLLAFIGISVTHIIFISALDQTFFKRRILFYGAGESAQSLLERMQRKADRRLFHIVGCIPVPNEPIKVIGEPLLETTPADLEDLCHTQHVDEIVVIPDERRLKLPLDAFLNLRLDGIQTSDALSFYERYMGKLKTDLMSPSSIIFSEGFDQNRYNEVPKRIIDLGLSLAMLIVAWPLLILAAIAIWVEEGLGAPVFYRQTRIGLYGQPFKIIKLRSMRVDAEADGKAKWAGTKDSRVTRVGSFLRKYRIDELPQLINVIREDMSLVGPRPERPEFVEDLRKLINYYDLRHRVRPGITGWAQLSYPYGANERDAMEKLQFDLYYVKNANLVLDIYILIGTVEVILLGKGGR
ncbi:hypothetical protein BJI67_07005 [Acidihalobacter aeolianus]|uniref:Bacterial sugar transferase domain-containing protein n=1 Tax=Acidihalobacter aeolianus TaxID=2792603 RepID=A0A1D8K7B9_9GAMM|nr:TIGR03013 family XrtA/PEP-CTERM system glycosyltransferase [Acidihalobacter aeolianus]AOV16842.1 hypothetical protein BJI67_07005 [Acidihalobacter aeolianus]